MIHLARLPLLIAQAVALHAAARIGSLLEVHEPSLPDATDWDQVRRDMKQATYTGLIEWRESNLDAADIEADLLAWEREYQTRSAT